MERMEPTAANETPRISGARRHRRHLPGAVDVADCHHHGDGMIGHLILGAAMGYLAMTSTLWAASVAMATWGRL